MFKNTAGQKFRVFAFDPATGLPVTGDAANITVSVSKDYAAFADTTDTSATEEDATKAKGYYLVDATQAETNGDLLQVAGRSLTSGVEVVGAPASIPTRPTPAALAASIFTAAMVESYAADGAPPTLAQMQFMIYGLLANFEFDGPNRSVKKLDKTTEAMTFEIDSTTVPTSHFRVT